MIDHPNPEGGSELHAVEIPFEAPAAPMKFLPIADFLQLDVPKARNEGGIIIPGMPAGAALITADVIAHGPDCKMAKTGNTVLMVANGIMGGSQGAMIDGRRCFFTQEKYLLAVVAK